MIKPNKSKLEYSDEPDVKEVDEPLESPTVVATPVPPPSMKKASSDAQKATTARMRVKLEERRRDLVVIKQEAKETALLEAQAKKEGMITMLEDGSLRIMHETSVIGIVTTKVTAIDGVPV